jgi:activator of 2-hydroxyglutaryl-CoA dehydratase
MNRKCAAGTGAFFEEMAMRLDIGLEQMDDLARQSENMVKLGSFCTVFSATEVLENIRSGKKLPDIVKGVFFSMTRSGDGLLDGKSSDDRGGGCPQSVSG